MLKAIIVDDENKARENLKALLDEFCEGVEIIGMAESVKNAVKSKEFLEALPRGSSFRTCKSFFLFRCQYLYRIRLYNLSHKIYLSE